MPGINAGTYTVSASPSGYSPVSVSGVVVNGGSSTVQNLALTPTGSNSCFTDTAFGDFSTGSGTNSDIAASPGDVKLANTGGEVQDQNQASATTINTTPTSTTWAGQTFTAAKTGNLTKISVGLGLNSGSTGTVTVEIHNASSNTPGSTVLSSAATLGPVTNASGTVATYTTTFSSPAAVVSGTQYSIVIKGGTGSVYVVTGSSNPYAGGRYLSTTTSGGSWTAQTTADMTFTTYVTTPTVYQTSGNFISSTKDSGALVGTTPTWSTLSWTNAALPSGTTIQFQAAASNSSTGPFNFVGPDGTASTFFSNGGSLSQFNGNRYLKYKALLSTSNTANTPTLNDATVCFADLVPPILSSASSRKTHGGAGTFNLPLSLNGRTVEPRGDGSGTHTIVFNFDRTVNAGSATVTSGTGTAGAPTFSGSSMTVPLSGVADQQAVTLQVTNVSGPGTATLPSASVQIGFLQGDVTQDAFVNAGDTIVVRNNAGVTLDNTNFQNDVNFDGQVDVGDTTIVRNNSGDSLP
jgi:hypothetical protein